MPGDRGAGLRRRWAAAGLRTVAAVLVTAAAAARHGAGETPATVAERLVKADQALRHVGERCDVEMVVRAARKLPDREICFLNSRKDHRATTTFTAVIFAEGLVRFRESGIDNPALHFLDRKIRVRGLVEEREGRAQITIVHPDQVEVVEPTR